ncbi:MAG: hypothetical protein AAGA35_01705 [Patescibacteria group bacterium]
MPTTFAELIQIFINLINTAIPVLITLTIIYFIWRLIDAWILNGGDATKVQEGQNTALVGIIVIVIMLSVWAIIGFLRRSLFG